MVKPSRMGARTDTSRNTSGAAFWDRQAKGYDGPAPTPEDDEAVRRALEVLPRDAHVLEVGCATGGTGEALRPHVASWHGIDISGEMIRRAQRRAGKGLTFQQAAIDDTSLDVRRWDAIVAFNVLHFMDLDHDLERLARLLPPGGLLVAQTPCLGDLPQITRAVLPVVAALMRVKGLQRLRFQDLRTQVSERFEVVEEAERPAPRTWLVARRLGP